MTSTRCCQAVTKPKQRVSSRTRLAGWIVPGFILCLMPKCPLCLAAYIAIATGIVLPTSMSYALRSSLIVLCTASLLCGGAIFGYNLAQNWFRGALGRIHTNFAYWVSIRVAINRLLGKALRIGKRWQSNPSCRTISKENI